MREILEKVKIDRAIAEFRFNCPQEVLCFDFLVKDLNYFRKYEEVKKELGISRHHYKKVKEFIAEEIKSLLK